MTSGLAPTELAKRLLAVNWSDGGYSHTRSRQRLMHEYLRRAAWWVQELGCEEWPMPDFAAYIDPVVRADPALVRELETALALNWSRTVCLNALHWTTLRATPGIALPDLEDPFEPLLIFFERGGDFTMESNFIDVGGGAVHRKTWQHYLSTEQVVALDPAVLDELDQAARP